MVKTKFKRAVSLVMAAVLSKRMRNEIELDKQLFDELKAAHYVHETTRLSPKQQQILFMTWGPEKIILR